MAWELWFGISSAAVAAMVSFVLLVLGFPGTWLFLLYAFFFAWWTAFAWVGIGTLIALVVLASVGEVLEFWLGASAAARVRPSWKVALGALLGGLIGGLVGAPLLLGLGALLGALAGTFVGAALAAGWEGGSVDEMWRTGLAAMRGRWRGFLAKLATLCTMVAAFVTALFW